MTNIEKIKIIQDLSGLTQEKLAKKLGVSFATLNSWINGKSEPRKAAQMRINKLYFKLTGRKHTYEDVLAEKKQIILEKAKNKNILKMIVNNNDIYDQLLLSFTYNTNRIEGSTLTEKETRAVLFDNIALSNKSLVEQLEVKNHHTAWQYLLVQLSKKGFKIDENLILKLHSILMNSINQDAGNYRNHNVRILGSNVPTSNYMKVPQFMKQIIKDINSFNKDVISHVSQIHSRFEQIHPFSDGNGRIGRLIIQAMLLQRNLPPAIIKQKKKHIYYSCLQKSQLKDDFLGLEDFMCDSMLQGIRIIDRTI